MVTDMFTPIEEKQILKFNNRLSRDTAIGLISTQNTITKLFHDFCRELTRLAPRIQITRQDAASADPPQLIIGKGLRYQAVPAGPELLPFLNAVAGLDSGALKLTGPIKTRLEKNSRPADLTVFIAPQCSFCPQMVRRLISLPLTDDKLQLTIIDGSLFPEAVEAQRIQVVPTILLDNRFRWTGSILLEEIIGAIITRDPFTLGTVSLENILKEGGADRLAAMMLESKRLIPAFYDVLTHEKWPIRLGAMVVMEEIAEKDRELAAEVLSPLWERFHQVPAQIQGDILHVFGEIGDPRAVSWLEAVLSGGYHPEVKEAAKDALTVLGLTQK